MNEEKRAFYEACNERAIYSVESTAFQTYGTVIKGYDFSEITDYLEGCTQIPVRGNCYVASDLEMENMEIARRIKREIYGEMPIQVGFCNGRNETCNGFEYHKCSEINIAATDLFLILGHVWDMEGDSYDTEKAQVFFIEKGTAVELYQTTLHLSPCSCSSQGYKTAVILASGTNTALASEEKTGTLFLKNKWLIVHPEHSPLVLQGAKATVTGERFRVHYKVDENIW